MSPSHAYLRPNLGETIRVVNQIVPEVAGSNSLTLTIVNCVNSLIDAYHSTPRRPRNQNLSYYGPPERNDERWTDASSLSRYDRYDGHPRPRDHRIMDGPPRDRDHRFMEDRHEYYPPRGRHDQRIFGGTDFSQGRREDFSLTRPYTFGGDRRHYESNRSNVVFGNATSHSRQSFVSRIEEDARSSLGTDLVNIPNPSVTNRSRTENTTPAEKLEAADVAPSKKPEAVDVPRIERPRATATKSTKRPRKDSVSEKKESATKVSSQNKEKRKRATKDGKGSDRRPVIEKPSQPETVELIGDDPIPKRSKGSKSITPKADEEKIRSKIRTRSTGLHKDAAPAVSELKDPPQAEELLVGNAAHVRRSSRLSNESKKGTQKEGNAMTDRLNETSVAVGSDCPMNRAKPIPTGQSSTPRIILNRQRTQSEAKLSSGLKQKTLKFKVPKEKASEFLKNFPGYQHHDNEVINVDLPSFEAGKKDDGSIYSATSFEQDVKDGKFQFDNESQASKEDDDLVPLHVEGLNKEKISFYVGNNISQYWMEFLQERISVGHGILDNVGLLKCEFLKRKEHIFGTDFRNRMASVAADLVTYQYHANKYKKDVKKDADKREIYNYLMLSPKFKLGNKTKFAADDFDKKVQVEYPEDYFVRFAKGLASNKIFDAGFQIAALNHFESTAIEGALKGELYKCFCPCSVIFQSFQKRWYVDDKFSQGHVRDSVDRLNIFYNKCSEGPMTPEELYDHARYRCLQEQIGDQGTKRNHRKDPFHKILVLFLEFQYSCERPKSLICEKSSQTIGSVFAKDAKAMMAKHGKLMVSRKKKAMSSVTNEFISSKPVFELKATSSNSSSSTSEREFDDGK